MRAWTGDPAAELLVVAGGGARSSLELALAMLVRIGQLQRAGRRIRQVLIALGPDIGRQAFAARELLARGVLTHLLEDGEGELVLTADDRRNRAAPDHLLRLVGLLTPELGQSRISISALIDGGRRAKPDRLAKTPRGKANEVRRAVVRAGQGFDAAALRSPAEGGRGCTSLALELVHPQGPGDVEPAIPLAKTGLIHHMSR